MSPRKSADQKIICHCLQVTEQTVLEAIQTREIQTLKDVCRFTQAGDGCTACHPALEKYLREKGRLAGCPQEKRYFESSPAPSIFSDR